MRKIVAKPRKLVEVPKFKLDELGRIVLPTEIAKFAKSKCSACRGAGTFVTSKPKADGTSEKTTNACGCSHQPFVAANVNAIGYDPTEKGIPVRWRKGLEPAEAEKPPVE